MGDSAIGRVGMLLLGALLAFGAGILVWMFYHVKKYGWPEPPDDVRRLRDGLGTTAVHLDLNEYKAGRTKGTHHAYERSFETGDATWLLTVEYDNDELIAYQAVCRSRVSWSLGMHIGSWTKPPAILTPDSY